MPEVEGGEQLTGTWKRLAAAQARQQTVAFGLGGQVAADVFGQMITSHEPPATDAAGELFLAWKGKVCK